MLSPISAPRTTKVRGIGQRSMSNGERGSKSAISDGTLMAYQPSAITEAQRGTKRPSGKSAKKSAKNDAQPVAAHTSDTRYQPEWTSSMACRAAGESVATSSSAREANSAMRSEALRQKISAAIAHKNPISSSSTPTIDSMY